MEKFNATKYKNDFQKEKYDRIIVNVSKGKKTEIEEYRRKKGYKSLNEYITELIRRDMYENSGNSAKIIHVDKNDTINM